MYTFFAGSYTEYLLPDFGGTGKGIYSVQLDPNTEKLIVLNHKQTRNPSYLTLSEDRTHLYCVTELAEKDNPAIEAYRIQEDYSLKFENRLLIPGGYPCHLTRFYDNLVVACYATGNLAHYQLDQTGALTELRSLVQHHGSGPNKDRQEGPHAHQVVVHPDGETLFICDLGIDTIKAYKLENQKLVSQENRDCKVTTGGGPRHLVFSKNGEMCYVMNELSGDVSILKSSGEGYSEISTVSSLPRDYNGVPSGSAIRMHPNGKYVYVANRGSETLTVLEVDGTGLQPKEIYKTGGKELREFNLTPDGEWLIACHQNSHDTAVYKVRENGLLDERYRTTEILSPVCVLFR